MPEELSMAPLSRRNFVKVAGVAALSVSAVTFMGCGKEEAAPEPEPEMTKEEKYETLAVLALAQALTTYFPNDSTNDYVLEKTTYKVTSIVSEKCPSASVYEDLCILNNEKVDGTSVYGKFTLYDKYGEVLRKRIFLRQGGKGSIEVGSGTQFHCFFPDSGTQYIDLGDGKVFWVKVSI